MANELQTIEDVAASLGVSTDQVVDAVTSERIMPAAFIQRKCYDVADVSRIRECIERATARSPAVTAPQHVETR